MSMPIRFVPVEVKANANAFLIKYDKTFFKETGGGKI